MNLIRYYNQNRKKIWGILIIIFSALILLQLVNYIYKMNREKEDNENSNNQIEKAITNTTQLTTNQSVITGENVSSSQLESATTTIDKFISYCNNKELQKAYDLLTDECKRQMYPTLEIFEQAYYNNVFQGENKTCSIENWVDNIYKVRIIDDMISTGKKNNNYAKQDYITVKEEKKGYQLNINGYIGSTQINKKTEKDNIAMEVLSKNTYMEYEEYTINVTNQAEDVIVLDNRTDGKSLYLQDSKQNQYFSYNHELTEPMLTISSGETKEVTIRFYSSYISNKKIKYIVFLDLSLYNGQLSETIEFKAEV